MHFAKIFTFVFHVTLKKLTSLLCIVVFSLEGSVFSNTLSAESGNTKIPIILSIDNNYATYAYVTIYSILENANQNTYYDFYILTPEQSEITISDKISGLQKKYNCNIQFITIKSDSICNTLDDTPDSMYHRLLIADLLIKYSKCIYLDTDLIVLSDLTELFNTDLTGYYIAGVKDWASIHSYKQFHPRIIDKFIDLLDMQNYVNSGVLVMNLDLIRKHNLVPKFKELIKHGVDDRRSFPYQDQDIINIICRNHIKCIDTKYNFMSNFDDITTQGLLSEGFSNEEIEQIISNPTIIHYAMEKPWEEEYNSFSKIWWEYAVHTPFFTQIVPL